MSTPSNDNAETRRLWRLAAMGGTLASEILAGTLIGWGLDKLFGTDPVLIVVGTVGGVVVGMVTFILSALKESAAAGREATSISHGDGSEEREPDDVR